MAEKYGVYLIYILAESLYFLWCRVTNAHWIGRGGGSGAHYSGIFKPADTI
jgi:hypothetical protein